MRHTSIGALLAVVVFVTSVAAQGCNPEDRLLRTLSRQGLNLLRPARDYVAIGGVIIKARSGVPTYEEPMGNVGSQPGTSVDFSAVILQETARESMKLGAAIKLLRGFFAVPLNLQVNADQNVTLNQVNTTGRRLVSQGLQSLMQTDTRLKNLLSQKLRVFVVQEVYLAKDMTISAGSGVAVAAGYGVNAEVQKCPATTAVKPAEAAPAPAKAPEAKPEPKKEAAPAPPAAAAATPGVSVGLCRNADLTISLTSAQLTPLFVRLAEVQLMPDGTVGVKYGGGFVGSLGAAGSEMERTSALFDDAAPVIDGLQRRE